MSEVRLRAYCAEVEELIESGAYDEAIAACRHILGHYPKYVEAYRLLGEACLEKGEYPEAADLFKRVLGADPENFSARSGLGRIYEEYDSLDEAIWHTERAFELAPYQETIRNQLRCLYSRRDGIEVSRIKLTRGALGHLQVRDGLFQQAIAEFRSLLEEDGDLIDIQLALAEALWRDGQRQEAASACQDVLEKLPYCLKANLILGEIWFDSGREDDAEALFDIARALDPENILSQSLFGDHSPLPAEAVMITRFEEESPPPSEEMPGEESPPPFEEMPGEEPSPSEEMPGEEPSPSEEMPDEEPLAEEVTPVAESLSVIERCRLRLADVPRDHETRLVLARVYREEGEFEAAFEHYRRLVKSAALLDEVIADLVEMATERPDHHATLTLLGDAYTKDGRLQEALEAYREAMAKL